MWKEKKKNFCKCFSCIVKLQKNKGQNNTDHVYSALAWSCGFIIHELHLWKTVKCCKSVFHVLETISICTSLLLSLQNEFRLATLYTLSQILPRACKSFWHHFTFIEQYKNVLNIHSYVSISCGVYHSILDLIGIGNLFIKHSTLILLMLNIDWKCLRYKCFVYCFLFKCSEYFFVIQMLLNLLSSVT